MGRRGGHSDDSADAGDLDDLFGDGQFRDYDDGANPFVAPKEPPAPPLPPTPAAPAPDYTAPEYTVPEYTLPPLPPEEPRGPIHDRLSPTVAMPVQQPAAPATERIAAEPATERIAATSVTERIDETPAPASVAAPPRPGLWARLTTGQRRAVLGTAAGLVLVGLLFGLYQLGAALGTGTDAADTAIGDDPATSGAALEPGVHPWSALQGGECLDPFETAWAEEFTVVDCADGHRAQFMYRGEVGPEVTVYLDAAGWQGLTPALCDAATLLDLAVAGEYSELQWHLTYAGDATEWANGDRGYTCTVDRLSGEPIVGSLLAAPADS
jgi:hypothetical protein